VKATCEDVTGECSITVSASGGGGGDGGGAAYSIYTDDGLGTDVSAPARYGSPSGGDQSVLSEPAGGCSPDPSKCWKYVYTNIAGGWSGWYNQFASFPKDMSSYTNLKFYVKGASGGENFEIIVEDTSDPGGKKQITNYTTVTTNWQEVSIPLSDFGEDLTNIKNPYNICFSAGVTGGDATVYIDYVRWE